MTAKKQFDASSFAEECYQEYLAYDRVNGSGKPASFVDFCFEIINNREDMKEYLSGNPSLKTKYMKHLPEITEAFPFHEYSLIAPCFSHQGGNELSISFYSPAGQDFSLPIYAVEPDLSNFRDRLDAAIDAFDVSEETYIWLDETGHGTNGAPYELKDVLADMEFCIEECRKIKDDLMAVIDSHEKALEKGITKASVGELFIRNIGSQMIQSEVLPAVKEAGEKTTAFMNGNRLLLKEKLSEYLESIGLTEEILVNARKEAENKDLTADDRKNLSFIQSSLNHEIYELEQKDIASRKPIVTKFTDRIPSSTEVKICRMFDALFTESDTYPEMYVEHVVIPARDSHATETGAVRWWDKAIDHAVNSGGDLWQCTYDRMQLFEKYGLIPEGTCKLPDDNPVFEKHFSSADKKYGEYMHTYLSLKGLLKEEDRIKAVNKDREWNQKYGR